MKSGENAFPYSILKHKDLVLFFLLSFIAILISVLTSQIGILSGVVVFSTILAVFIIGFSLGIPVIGFYALYCCGFFLFVLIGLLNVSVPVSVILDFLILLILASILIRDHFRDTNVQEVSAFKSPIGAVIIITVLFDLVQVFNPKSAFGIGGSAPVFRESLYLILVFYITYRIFNTSKSIINYTYLILFLSSMAASYGLFQEYFGLRDFEWEWLRADPRRLELYYIWGSVRKWSFLSDPSVFGMLMAFCGIFCFLLAIGYGSIKFRIFVLILSFIFFLAMSYSGTRTAYGMVPLGISLYFFLSLSNFRILLVSIVTTFFIIGLLFGPFYGPTLNRIRSTFNRNDPSMSFRDQKRAILQQYVLQNPFGTGLNSANAVAKRLTITADTDNGYLRTAIDKGIQGLILQLCLFAAVMITGVRQFYSLTGINKVLCGAYLSGIFALSFANFYQDVTDQKPLNLILASVFAIVLTFKKTK